jgi:hypothetical protein
MAALLHSLMTIRSRNRLKEAIYASSQFLRTNDVMRVLIDSVDEIREIKIHGGVPEGDVHFSEQKDGSIHLLVRRFKIEDQRNVLIKTVERVVLRDDFVAAIEGRRDLKGTESAIPWFILEALRDEIPQLNEFLGVNWDREYSRRVRSRTRRIASGLKSTMKNELEAIKETVNQKHVLVRHNLLAAAAVAARRPDDG